MLAEFVIDRESKRNPVDAFAELSHGNWSFAGGLDVVTTLVTLAFYGVVGGWVLSYMVSSATGAYFGDTGGFFASVSTGSTAVVTHAVFMAITIGVVPAGIEDGIECATKVMIPAIIALLVALGIWVATLDGAAAAYEYYLSPGLGVLAANFASIAPSTLGQAFFTLSLGFSVKVVTPIPLPRRQPARRRRRYCRQQHARRAAGRLRRLPAVGLHRCRARHRQRRRHVRKGGVLKAAGILG